MHHPRALATTAMVLVLTALAATGCGTEADAPDAGPGPDVDAACAVGGGAPPWLLVGTGAESFVALAPGAEIELIHGPQGGYHLSTTALFGLGVSPDDYVLRYEVRRLDGTLLGTTGVALLERRLARACGGWFRGGDIVVLSISGPTEVAGDEVDLSVQLLQGTTELARDVRRVRVVDGLP